MKFRFSGHWPGDNMPADMNKYPDNWNENKNGQMIMETIWEPTP